MGGAIQVQAKEGGTIAGDARKALEAKSGKPVLGEESYLVPPVASAREGANAPHHRQPGARGGGSI